jgi:hypothetical protein
MVLRDLVFTPDGRTQVGYDGGSCDFRRGQARGELHVDILPAGRGHHDAIPEQSAAREDLCRHGRDGDLPQRARAKGVDRIGSRGRDPQLRPAWVRATSRHRTTIARAVPAYVALSQNALEGSPNLNWHLPGGV